jgi:hypothetical protein
MLTSKSSLFFVERHLSDQHPVSPAALGLEPRRDILTAYSAVHRSAKGDCAQRPSICWPMMAIAR